MKANQPQYPAAAIALASLLVALVFAAVSLFFFARELKQDQQTYATDFLYTIQQMAAETAFILNTLNETQANQCNDDLLKQMRQMIFKSEYAKDIGFYEGDFMVCTTGLGQLKEPIPSGVPDFIAKSGHSVWMYENIAFFDESYSAFVIKWLRFNIVLDPGYIAKLGSDVYTWEWVYKDDTQLIPVLGKTGLYNAIAVKNESQGLFTISHFECSNVVTYCVATAVSLFSLISANTVLIAIVGFILVFFISFLALREYAIYYRSIDARIKKGLSNHAFYPLFQPIVRLEDGKIIGCEVLMRFEDKLGPLTPDNFIHRISQLKLTTEFSIQVFSLSLTQLTRQRHLPKDFKVNFNIFPKDLSDKNTHRLLESQNIQKTRFKLCLEITEDEPFESDEILHNVLRLRSNGFEVAIDDFGTGYSNLGQLQRLSFDYLKIDKSYVLEMEDGSIRSTLVPYIVDIANKLNVEVVAEGIENEAQHASLHAVGVALGQGWQFGKPMTARELSSLVVSQAENHMDDQPSQTSNSLS